MNYGYEKRAAELDKMVLGSIKSFSASRPATLGDLWGMQLLRRNCSWAGDMSRSLQRLKKAGKIRYSRKPAGWVAT